MFTKTQLSLLISAQSREDWSPNGFVQQVVIEGKESDLLDSEYDELMAMLEPLTYEQVRDLQMALMILDDLPLAH